MSTAHRPTFDPAQGRSDNRHNSKITSVRDLPAHTSLKYRRTDSGSGQAVPSSNDHGGETREALKARLAKAERDARNKKRKAEGLEAEESDEEGAIPADETGVDADGFKKPSLPLRLGAGTGAGVDDEASKDDDEAEDDDDDDDEEDEDDAEIEARAKAILREQGGAE